MAVLWDFPGGKINPGEITEDALVREIQEELQFSIQWGKKNKFEAMDIQLFRCFHADFCKLVHKSISNTPFCSDRAGLTACLTLIYLPLRTVI